MQDFAARRGSEIDGVSDGASAPVRFAGFVLDRDACTLARDSGEIIALTRGEFTLLRAFIARPGRVLSRDVLLSAVANRRVEPFDRSIDVMVGRVRRKIEPDPKRPRLIVTVPGEGYRFDGLGALERSKATDDPPRGAKGVPAPPKRESGGRPSLSIVVLPLTNPAGDAEFEFFVDGVTDCLTSDLSRLKGAFVIARGTAHTFKGQAIDVTALGRELNVRYALQGSVQRAADRLRINVQLLDAESGAHLWAERFDKPVADYFEMQDEIVARLANHLLAELVNAEARRAEKTQVADALGLVFRGHSRIFAGISPEGLFEARRLFQMALALDGDNAAALTGCAQADFLVATYLAVDPAAHLAAAEAAALRAVSLAPNSAFAHVVLGMVLGGTRRAEEGIAECERALALDPNLAMAHAVIGAYKQFVGRPEETEAHVQKALRLSPRDPSTGYWRMFVGFAKLSLGDLDEAIAWLRASLQDNRNNPLAHFGLAATLGLGGRRHEARSALEAGLALNPRFTVAEFLAQRRSDHPRALAARAIMVEGLREAGLADA